jgi:hypothetical protein
MWRGLLVQPVSRAAVYAAHVIYLLALTLASSLIAGLGYLAAGGLLFRFPEPVEWDVVFGYPVAARVAAFPAVTLQTWLGVRFRSIGVPLVVGAIGLTATFALDHAGEARLLLPWGYPMLVHPPGSRDTVLALSLGLLLAVLGALDFSRKDVS